MNRFRKLSLFKQIITLTLMMLVILLISFVISNTIAERIIEKKVSDSVNKILLQAGEKVMSFYADMEGISTYLLYIPTVQTFMDLKDDLDIVLMHDEIISVFNKTMTLKENIRGIQLFDKEGKMIASIGAGTGTGRYIQPPVETTKYSGLLTNPNTSETSAYYTITVPIYDLKSSIIGDYRGTGVFIMDARNFSNILKSGKITNNSQFLLLDQNNTIMASEGYPLDFNQISLEDWKNDKRYIVQTVTLSQTGWKLISVIPKNELLQELGTVKRLNIATYTIVISLLCLFLFIFTTRILKPIKAIMDFMKSYPKMGQDSRFNIVYHNEIGVLASNLNRMLDEIDTLGKEIQLTQKQKYEIEIVKKQMEISAFRNQINPHFLYNTLECIRAMAFYHKVQDIADISESLSNMFRYAVKGNNFVTIRDEITHVKEYAKIIEFRFMGRMRVTIEADEDLLGMNTLKMLLQPIVENAVFHGLEKRIEDGVVQVKVHKSGLNRINFTIRDNGYGMDEGRLEEILHRLRQFNTAGQSERDANQGIGLSNIYRRIKLLYGDYADMTIESALHIGTTVTVTIPIQNHSETTED
ncbi:sensor histidine kinase [Paenibacillus tarimensis]